MLWCWFHQLLELGNIAILSSLCNIRAHNNQYHKHFSSKYYMCSMYILYNQNYWWALYLMIYYWRDFKLTTLRREIHCYSLNGYIKFGCRYTICQTAKLKWPPNILVVQYITEYCHILQNITRESSEKWNLCKESLLKPTNLY